MRVALVHDYIKEYGGAERVLEALCEVFPEAPIYTAFYSYDSLAYKKFEKRKIFVSLVHFIPFFATKLHSPLRFLAPFIWNSFDLRSYDVIIASSGWYVTKGFRHKKGIEICYCHTPPRWLYGYKTSIEFQKYLPIKIYAVLVGHLMRMYDFNASQKVDYFIANSKEVAARINKFYRRDATVIYPPVSLPITKTKDQRSKIKYQYYLVVGRIVGTKGLDLAIEASRRMGFKLKIAGVPAGYYSGYEALTKKAKENVEFLGFVSDERLVELYTQAKGFLALAEDEDFGITPVESMLCGTGVVAYYGGGYKETLVQDETGVFFKEYTVESLISAIKAFEILRKAQGKKLEKNCRLQAEKFSKERFKKEILKFVKDKIHE